MRACVQVWCGAVCGVQPCGACARARARARALIFILSGARVRWRELKMSWAMMSAMMMRSVMTERAMLAAAYDAADEPMRVRAARARVRTSARV
jgi:hypothetical protein